MGIKRYTAYKDNTITNAFKSDLQTRATGSNMGLADSLEVFSIFAQANSSSLEASRILVQFPVSSSDPGDTILADRIAGIVNIGIDFVAKADVEVNRFLVLDRANQALRERYAQKMDIGEPFYITEIYKTLQDVDGIIDVLSVNVTQKTGTGYSDTFFDLEAQISADGRYIEVPLNAILEIKNPDQDILGAIK